MKTNITAAGLTALLIAAVIGFAESQPDSSAKAVDTVPAVPQLPAAPLPAANTVPADADTVKSPETIVLVKSRNDTVLMITDEHEISKLLKNVSSTVKKSRMQGYGGGGGPSDRIAAFNMNPVKELVASETALAGRNFPGLGSGFELIALSGGLGYGGLGNGIRIGGGGYGGSRKFVSDPYTNNGRDSVVVLKTNISYGGLLIEKAIVRDKWNGYAGGFIGGGSLRVEKSVSPKGWSSAFSPPAGTSGSTSANAALMTMELHGGATYTLVSWLHVGGDCSAMFYNAFSGFEGSSTGTGFFGVMPGLGIRIIFGNIG